MIGYSNGAHVTIKNALSIGSVQSPVAAQFFGAVKSTRSSINNSYYQGENVNGSASTVTLEGAVKVTDEQLASSEVVLNLGIAWRQDLGTDAYPAPNALKPVVVKITDAGYATLFVDNADITIPAGVTAYTAVNKDNKYLELVAVDTTIPAETPVILKGEPAIYEFVVPGTETSVPDGALELYDDEVDGSQALVKAYAEPVEGNVLKGAAEDMEAAGKYVLAKVDPETEGYGYPAAFCLADKGTIKAGKAYLEVPSDVKSFYFVFPGDDATDISTIDNVIVKGESIYNLAGQRIQKMQKGVNIVNGKKVLF
jgi:hypothetical protein